jgi:HAD superfamily hydrolase (TIGR01509 family)
VIEGVIFDLDGVIVQSEELWDEVRQALTLERGGAYGPGAGRAMMGMSAPEWSSYMHEELGVPEPPDEISAEVVRRMAERYRRSLPLIPGAVEAVNRLAALWPLAVASSANRELIELVLERSGLDRRFRAILSSEEVARGKPAPDVYLEAARRLGVEAGSSGAVEDSHNGIRSAHAAGLFVVAIPNPAFPPDHQTLEQADVVLDSIVHLDASVFDRSS